ncbi:MAG TPA: thioesterase domain-containing protein [Polyangiales bacterium]|nr:thioesterase domain-containing protein [Polyangiales bacterium]
MSRIRVLQATGTRKPLYIFPGIGGTLDTFVDLARRFSGERPVYGVKAVGEQNECEPLREMHQLAATHAADIRMVQRHGPYYLFGYSFGGSLAFEVARELMSHGERVGLVALADAPAPGYPKLPPAWRRAQAHVNTFYRLDKAGRLAYLKERVDRRVKRVRHMLGIREPVQEVVAAEENPVSQRVVNALAEAYKHYVPTPLSVDVLFLQAETQPDWPATKFDDPLAGWGPVLRGRIVQCQTPGSHLKIFDAQHVEVLVQHLKLGIAQAERAENFPPSVPPPAFS